MGGLEVATTQALYPEPGSCHVLALLPDVLPLTLLQLHQEVLESPVTFVLPAFGRDPYCLPMVFMTVKPSLEQAFIMPRFQYACRLRRIDKFSDSRRISAL